MLSRILIYRPR